MRRKTAAEGKRRKRVWGFSDWKMDLIMMLGLEMKEGLLLLWLSRDTTENCRGDCSPVFVVGVMSFSISVVVSLLRRLWRRLGVAEEPPS